MLLFGDHGREAYEVFLLCRYRIVPYRSYVKGWKVSPSHYVNQDLAAVLP
jgi:peptide/nickel transport system substrate-binding protein